jgi:signal transduction histidine kinase
VTPPRPRRTTARRIVTAFSLVLLLFALALAVVLVALDRLGAAAEEDDRVDSARHEGHVASSYGRDQYVHVSQTLLAWKALPLDRYTRIVADADTAVNRLIALVDDPRAHALAIDIGRVIRDSDRAFRTVVLPAIARDDRPAMPGLTRDIDQRVDDLVRIATELDEMLDARADAADARARALRTTVRWIALVCFTTALGLAGAVGASLVRTISRRVEALREGAERVGTGDLTARIGLDGDDEFTRLAAVFDRMTADLAEHQRDLLDAHRLASIGQVASGVAHEINNPLAAILGYVTVLRRDAALADRDELAVIEDEARQCQTIVAGLLELARPVKLARAIFDLPALVGEVIDRVRETGHAGDAELEVHGPRIEVSGDEAKLRQVVRNLILNAVQAANDSAARGREVIVTSRREDDRVVLEIIDRGPGISADAAARLFEPFFSTKPRGHGLGLAISRTIARAHGGDVSLVATADGAHAMLILPGEPKP